MLSILKDTEYFSEKGREIALKIKDRVPVIYSSEKLKACSYRMKSQFNENAKHPAFFHTFPELCHNELVAFQGMERSKYIVLLLKNSLDHDRIKRRMEICKNLFEDTVDVEEIVSLGESLLSKIFSLIYLGDWISYHLAIWKREDPSPVYIIENLKKELEK
jgi:glucose/mannose-6-phosphate isomerase